MAARGVCLLVLRWIVYNEVRSCVLVRGPARNGNDIEKGIL